MKLPILAVALAVAACTPVAINAPAADAPLILHYLRSNQDGGVPENVWLYRPDDTRVEVYKSVERCGNAAFVTAAFDAATGQATELIGGRVAQDGSQEQFAWLNRDGDQLHARVPSANIDERVTLGGADWVLYDFDLSDFNARHIGRPAPAEDFSFWANVVWLEEEAPSIFRTLGETRARFAGEDTRFGHGAIRYDVSGGLNGQLWLDADEGYILEARFAEPNHREYANFRLTLEGVSRGGEAEWRSRLAAHWDGCPAE